MRIGILTFHRALNVGAILQAYASVKLLEGLGHEAFLLDYRCPAIELERLPWRHDRQWARHEPLSYAVKYLPLALARNSRQKAFDAFIAASLPIAPLSAIDSFDYIFIGSDQVWNPALTGGADPYYCGAFSCRSPKIAWAASAGRADALPEGLSDGRFAAISVRESTLAQRLPGSTLLTDPTLMVSPEEWFALAPPSDNGYVLAYAIQEEEKTLAAARQAARKASLPLKIIPRTATWRHPFDHSGPLSFLSLIAGASHVITSSFHGSAFARIYGKPLTITVKEGADERLDQLRRLQDLEKLRSDALTFLHQFSLA